MAPQKQIAIVQKSVLARRHVTDLVMDQDYLITFHSNIMFELINSKFYKSNFEIGKKSNNT